MLLLYLFDGIEFATETLIGNSKGKEESQLLLPVLQIAVLSNFLVGVIGAGVCFLFPQTIFEILTNHEEVTEQIQIYLPWLVCVLGLNSVFTVLERYFAGLAQTQFLRSAVLWGALLGFAPLAVLAWNYDSNHILWLAMSEFRLIRVVVPAFEIPGTLKDYPVVITSKLPDS